MRSSSRTIPGRQNPQPRQFEARPKIRALALAQAISQARWSCADFAIAHRAPLLHQESRARGSTGRRGQRVQPAPKRSPILPSGREDLAPCPNPARHLGPPPSSRPGSGRFQLLTGVGVRPSPSDNSSGPAMKPEFHIFAVNQVADVRRYHQRMKSLDATEATPSKSVAKSATPSPFTSPPTVTLLPLLT